MQGRKKNLDKNLTMDNGEVLLERRTEQGGGEGVAQETHWQISTTL